MFRIVAFAESQDLAGAWGNIKAVPDQHAKATGDYIFVPSDNNIIGELACLGADAAQCRLRSPSIDAVNYQYLNGIINALVPDETNMEFFHPSAIIPLDIDEQLEVEENSDPAVAEEHTVIIALAPGALAPVTGNIRTIEITFTPTLAKGVWAYAEVTTPDGLPVGAYNVVGARVECATAIAFRLVFTDQVPRPGGICVPNEEVVDVPYQRKGGLGVWGSFHTVSPPGIEVIDSADTGATALTGYLDIIRV